ncbi:unnamed protein product [Mytilus edulis]|uniref:DUF1758 domain-containing protein n=1 Tax=Mytilus edulis TaxID=6550 RepID=A0A8S3QTV0_MYTED|nr:unnamed protein product [Mytilus edulis]
MGTTEREIYKEHGKEVTTEEMAVVYLKGLCTRYNKLLAKELNKSGDIIAQWIQDESSSTQIRHVLLAERRLKDFAAKLEYSMKEISHILEEKEDKEADIVKFTRTSELYFKLLNSVTQRLDELKIFEEKNQEAAESQYKESNTGHSSEEKQQSKIQSNNSNFQPRKHISARSSDDNKAIWKTLRQSSKTINGFGSQRTYITEYIIKRLNLKKKATEEITLVTFGADKPKILRTQKVSLKIRLKDGVCMLIDDNVVPKITIPLHMDVCENVKYLCNNLQLADTLPSCLKSSTIEILIGNDYYLDIILPQKIEIQQGLYLLVSKLGWILTVRSQLIDEARDNKMTMTVNGLISITECCLHSTIDTRLQIKPFIEELGNYWDTIYIRR